MAIKETSYVAKKTKAKFFTGGKPKDFKLVTEATGARVTANIDTNGKSYKITTDTYSFYPSDMREFAELLNELADVTDGKLAA